MAHFTLTSHVRDKLVVGKIDTSFLSATSRIFPGTAILNGPVVIGATGGLGVDRATCMIGPPMGGLSVPASLEVVGNTNLLGPVSTIAGLLQVSAVSNFTGSVTINAVATKNGADLKNAVNIGNATGIFNGPVTINAPLTVAGEITTPTIKAAFGAFASVAAPFKLFDIPHPNKKGMRLRHSCIEGPEIGVYYRGKLVDENKIILPDYWDNLIDVETITVNLTPHNVYQELYVKNIEWGKNINIVNNLGGPINCSYVVFAERKDVNKLIIEYKEEIK